MSIEEKFKRNVSLANHTTFRIGGPAKYFFEAKTTQDLKKAILWAKEKGLPFFILGGGSNLLVSDEGFEGLVIKNQNSKIKIQNENSEVKIINAEAGAPFIEVILETAKHGFSGAEWGFGIPGTLGGAICGNAGRLGQDISQVVGKVLVLDEDLEEKTLSARECVFDYRESRFKRSNEIILAAELIFKKGKQEIIDKTLDEAKQVIKKSPPFPSAGCVFKNYKLKEGDPLLKNYPDLVGRVRNGKIGVGYLIEQCGLKGKQVGGAKVWEGHANYIVNTGGAKAKDIVELIKICQNSVKEKYGLQLEEEIRRLGF